MTDEDSVFDLYHKVHKEIIKNIRDSVKPYDFNRGELPVLGRLIEKGDGASQKEIRNDLPISKSTMSKTIDNLTRKGYLRKEKNPKDRRSTLIYLTEKGKEMESAIREVNRKTEKIMLRGFSEGEEEELTEYLEKILKNYRKTRLCPEKS